MTNKQVAMWFQTNRPGTQWRVAGDINSQKDVDANVDWFEPSPKPTFVDLNS